MSTPSTPTPPTPPNPSQPDARTDPRLTHKPGEPEAASREPETEPLDTSASGEAARETTGEEPSGPNWALLILGALVVLYGLLVISMRPAALGFLAVLAGIAFVVAGIAQFGIANQHTGTWRWVGYLGGAIGIAAGIATFVWPGISLFVIAAIAAWLFVINGVARIVSSLGNRTRDMWWLGLVVGVVELLLGLWAIGSPLREIFLLVNLIGIFLVVAGFDAIVSALSGRDYLGERHMSRAPERDAVSR